MIFLLLFIYQIKHFLADYPLQGKYMLGKFKDGYGWILPLLAHVGVHGAMTFVIALFIKPEMAGLLAFFDMAVHFTMDRIKASPTMLGRYKALTKKDVEDYQQSVGNMRDQKHPEIVLFVKNQDEKFKKDFKSNVYFWWSLGLDQMVHHLTHYVIIWELVK